MILRSKKVAFIGYSGDGTIPTKFSRLTNATELSISKNPNEYTRKYVDEDYERTDVTRYSESISYKFDDDPTLSEDCKILKTIDEEELLGEKAVVTILMVDLTDSSGTQAPAKMRNYSVIPSSHGDDSEIMTYSGSLKCNGEITKVTASSSDGWKTATVATSVSE